ncbi:MAG: hypothetical protein WAL09_03505 [Pseudolabrys sp.]
MEIVFWVIVAIIVLAVVYVWALSFRKRKEALGRESSMSDGAPDTKGHGIDLQARKPMTTLPERFVPAGFAAGR